MPGGVHTAEAQGVRGATPSQAYNGSRSRLATIMTPQTNETSASEQIDAIIQATDDWRGLMLANLRAVILKANRKVVEEVKWKMPSRPEGVPVWSHAGTLCVADTLKNAVRLTFPKGAQMKDPKTLFNTRLDSKTVRAIDFHEGDRVPVAALKALIVEAMRVNALPTGTRPRRRVLK